MHNIPGWMRSGSRAVRVDRDESDFSSLAPAFDLPNYEAATNTEHKVIDLIRQIVMGDDCLIVTGYQDFLSALSIIMEVRPGISHAEPGTIRLLFGTNTDNLRYFSGSGPRQHLPDHVRRHYMSQSGVFVRDTRDIRAIQARRAIKSGAIQIRVFDEEKAEQSLGFFPGMMHAKLFVSEDYAATGSASFSRRGLTSNIEFTDRLLNGFDAHSARLRAGESFWQWGRDWRTEALQILEHLIRSVDAESALARTLIGMGDFAPWQRGAPDQKDQAGAASEMIYGASQTLYEHGFTYCEPPQGSSPAEIGKGLGAILAETYDRCVMRDETDHHRRQGTLALVPAGSEAGWRRGKRATVRLAVEDGDADHREALSREMDFAAGLLMEEPLRGTFMGAPARMPAMWSGCLAPRRPGDRALEGALERLSDMGSIFITDGMARAIETMVEKRADGRDRTTGATSRDRVMDEAYLSALKASVGTILCQADPPKARHEVLRAELIRREVRPSPAQRDALKSLSTQIQRLRGQVGDTPAVSQAMRRLVGALRQGSDHALRVWTEDGLSATFREIEGGGATGGAAEQGFLPMFSEETRDVATPVSDMIEKVLNGRPMKGIDRGRAKVIADIAAEYPGLILPAETTEAALALARAISLELTEGLVLVGSPDHAPCPVAATAADAFAPGAAVPALVIAPLGSLQGVHVRDARGYLFGAAFEEPDILPSLLSQIGSAENEALIHVCLDLPALRQGREAQHLAALARISSPERAGDPFEVDYLEPADIVSVLLTSFSQVKDKSPANLSAAMATLRGHIDPTVQAEAAENNPAGAWGAEYASLPSERQFTAFFMAGKCGRRSEDFAPPRLLVVESSSQDQDVVLRNQAACLSLLSDAFETARTSEAGVPGSGEMNLEDLEVVSRHLSHLTHWDLRPERSVTPLAVLADFLGLPTDDDGMEAFGDLTLPSLEVLCDRWIAHLGQTWTAMKLERETAGEADRSELLTSRRVYDRFRERAAWEVDSVRSSMRELLEELRFADRDQSKSLQDRVSVIIRGVPCA